MDALLGQWLENDPRGHSHPTPFKSLNQDKGYALTPMTTCYHATEGQHSCNDTWASFIHWKRLGVVESTQSSGKKR